MTTEDRKDLARLLHSQAMAVALDIGGRAIAGRMMTDVALKDTKRILEHMIRSIDERDTDGELTRVRTFGTTDATSGDAR